MKALILTGKYAQDIEVFYPLYRMQEEGWEVDIAVQGDQPVAGVYGMKITPTANMPELIQKSWNVLILPGGARAMEYLRQDKRILESILWFSKWGGTIGSICHGTQLLISARVVRGKRVSGYYSIRDDVTNAGGEFVDAPFITDGKLICSPHYKYLGPWMAEVIRVAIS